VKIGDIAGLVLGLG